MLKLLACLFMLIDHIGFYFEDAMPYPLYMTLRCIGRLAFPIFAWSVARGCERTRNPFYYFLRMCAFAVLTEILIRYLNTLPNVPHYPTNVMITFALAIVLVFGYQMLTRAGRDVIASLRPISPTLNTAPTAPRYDVRINLGGIELDSRLGLLVGMMMIALSIAATAWLRPDYSFFGIFAVLLFFIIHERLPEKDWQISSFLFYLALNLAFVALSLITNGAEIFRFSMIECLSVAAIPICYFFSREKKPAPTLKYAVYIFYPLHILFLVLLRTIIMPG